MVLAHCLSDSGCTASRDTSRSTRMIALVPRVGSVSGHMAINADVALNTICTEQNALASRSEASTLRLVASRTLMYVSVRSCVAAYALASSAPPRRSGERSSSVQVEGDAPHGASGAP
eukprot:5173440-Prymnesium_polylepis.2